MNNYLVRVLENDGSVAVVNQSFSQLCETLRGAGKENRHGRKVIPQEFWNGEESVLNERGQSIKLVTINEKQHTYIGN